jgi:hypothetical protein
MMASALKGTPGFYKMAHLVKNSEASKIRGRTILFLLTGSHNNFILVKENEVFEALLLVPGTSIEFLVRNGFGMFVGVHLN